MGWSKRRGTMSKEKEPADFPALKERMLSQLEEKVKEHNIPKELVINWDQTGIHFIPIGHYTMETTGAHNVPVAGLDDKREFTAVDFHWIN
jgi:molybdopterin-guanine dinucleotide biosynthesis protein A